MNQSLMEQSAAVGILSQSFDVLFTSTEDGFKNMIESIITGLKRLVAELLARMAVLTILNAITGGGARGGIGLKGAPRQHGIHKDGLRRNRAARIPRRHLPGIAIERRDRSDSP